MGCAATNSMQDKATVKAIVFIHETLIEPPDLLRKDPLHEIEPAILPTLKTHPIDTPWRE
jgi:hypothetical protein